MMTLVKMAKKRKAAEQRAVWGGKLGGAVASNSNKRSSRNGMSRWLEVEFDKFWKQFTPLSWKGTKEFVQERAEYIFAFGLTLVAVFTLWTGLKKTASS